MNVFTKPTFYLRLGLGLTYAYSGFSIIRHPENWSWALHALPAKAQAVIHILGNNNYLLFQGGLEIFFAIVFLLWFAPTKLVKTAAVLAALEMAAIIFFVHIDPTTFRDMGILGALLALVVSA